MLSSENKMEPTNFDIIGPNKLRTESFVSN